MSKIIRSYTESDREIILELISKNYDRNFSDSYLHYFDWLHSGSLLKSDKSYAGKVLEINNKIFAYLGIIPCAFKIGSQVVETGFICDLISDPQKRGSGIHIVKDVIFSNYLYLGAPGERVVRLFKQIGNEVAVVSEVVRMFSIVNPKAILLEKGLPGVFADVSALIWKQMFRILLNVSGLISKSQLQVTKQREFTDEVNALCEEFAEGFNAIHLKNRDFLNWRFCKLPHSYEMLFARNAEKLLGYLVYRYGYIKGKKVLLIVEAIAIEPKIQCYEALLNQVFAEALEAEVCYVIANESGCKSFLQTFRRKGGFTRPETAEIISNHKYITELNTAEFEKQSSFFSLADSDFEFANVKLD